MKSFKNLDDFRGDSSRLYRDPERRLKNSWNRIAFYIIQQDPAGAGFVNM